MKFSIFQKIVSVSMAAAFILTSTGFGMMVPQRAHAQGGVVDTLIGTVVGGNRVLDGCEGINSSRFGEIATQLGLDLGGGVRGGLSALGDEFGGSAQDALLGGLSSIGGALADSAIGEAVSGIGSSIGDALGGLAGGALSVALPGIGSVIGGVVGGLFGGGGPEEVIEKGLRKVVQQGNQILQYQIAKNTEKERCLDSLARDAGNAALRDLTNASMEWIDDFERSGETGNTAFIQDLEQYMSEVSDSAFVDYINEAGEGAGSFSNICSFLRQDVYQGVGQGYINTSDPSGVDDFDGTETPDLLSGGCALLGDSLTQEEAEAFLRGDFSAGGWSSLARSAQDPGSSAIGSYLQQSSELSSQIEAAEEDQREQLRWGEGFLADQNSVRGGFTPASIVGGITERLFTSDISRIELIDEMGEVSGSLANSLIGKITGGDSDPSAGSGLSDITGDQNTVGGVPTDQYGSLIASLEQRVNEQLAIEDSVWQTLELALPLYQDERVQQLSADMQNCLETTEYTDQNANELLASLNNSIEVFENSILQSRVRIDWRGDDFFFTPVIREENRKMIGWNNTDYNWRDDEVNRYYQQGTAEGCSTDEDTHNVSYVIRDNMIVTPEDRFRGRFSQLEPEPDDDFTLADDSDGNRDTRNTSFIDDKHFFSFSGDVGLRPMEVHTTWEKQICLGGTWMERWRAPGQDDFAESPEGEKRYQNAQCDLYSEYQYCLAPAYRAPRIIAGETYQRNSDGEVEVSRCRNTRDAGDHYFVRSGDDTWSIRECVSRQSPQGTPVEWQSGFPDSAESTDIPAYESRTTATPLEDQGELIESLEEVQAAVEDLEDNSNDFPNVQEDFYLLQDMFNSRGAAEELQRNTRNFIENVRKLNEILIAAEECSGGDESLRSFGSVFLDENPEEEGEDDEPLNISEFTANRPYPTSSFVQIRWSSNAENCTATSLPSNTGWQGEVAANGVTGANFSNGATLSLSCSRDGEETPISSVSRIEAPEEGGPRGPGEPIRTIDEI